MQRVIVRVSSIQIRLFNSEGTNYLNHQEWRGLLYLQGAIDRAAEALLAPIFSTARCRHVWVAYEEVILID